MEKYDITKPMKIPVGMHKLNSDPGISFQLNRLVNMDGCDLAVAKEIGPAIKSTADFYGVLKNRADSELEQGHVKNAAALYRMSEFYTDWEDENGLTIGLLNVVLYGFGWLINILYVAKKEKGMPFFRTYFHRMGTTNVYRLAKILWSIDLRPIADKLTKDYLIIGGSRDSMACRAGLGRHLLILRNARSVSSREITEFEQGADHCCCGNQTAAMDAVLLWAEMMERRDRSLDGLQK